MRSPHTLFIIPASVSVAIIAMVLITGTLFAWQEPVQSPPQGNVSTPLNIGSVGQSKVGGLILNTGGAQVGLLVQQGNVGVGTTSPASSALLDLASTSKGFLLPRMSIAQRNAIANPTAGLQVFNTTDGEINYFNGIEWKSFLVGDIDPQGLDCSNAGGSWHAGQNRCYFYNTSCPSGWSKDASWTSTWRNTCTASWWNRTNTCTTGSHTRANRAQETCTLIHGHIQRGGTTYNHVHTCFASISETGCVKN